MTPQQAAEAPRFGSFSNKSSFYPWRCMPGLLGLEWCFQASLEGELSKLGHDVVTLPGSEFENVAFCMSIDLQPASAGRRVLAVAADARRSCCR